jgi:hypothetical protein
VTATPTFKRFLTTVSTFNPQQKRPSTYTLQRVLSLICGVIAVISFKARAPFFVLAVILTRQIENVNRAQQKSVTALALFSGFFVVFIYFFCLAWYNKENSGLEVLLCNRKFMK